ncbi:MAG: T9SS type A sorting domain-containing protein [Saprospiraceae bacterium]|nr:T9SS type A sorting domain-containing protein [Saprospiraceae bacterium]
MKKAILFLVIIFSGGAFSLNAQSFDPETKWYFCQDLFQDRYKCTMEHFESSFSSNDTLVSIFKQSDVKLPVKQHGKKVWIDGELAYDFGLSAGDSIKLGFGESDLKKAVIESVEVVSIFGEPRTVQFVSILNYRDLIFVEGLGTVNEWSPDLDLEKVSYNFLQNTALLKVDPPKELNYLSLDEKLVGPFENSPCESCSQLVSNEELTLPTVDPKAQFYDNTLRVTGLSANCRLSLYNASGQLLIQKNTQSETEEISVNGISAGQYLLRIDQRNGKGNTLKVIKF